jgi:hypothetical protein
MEMTRPESNTDARGRVFHASEIRYTPSSFGQSMVLIRVSSNFLLTLHTPRINSFYGQNVSSNIYKYIKDNTKESPIYSRTQRLIYWIWWTTIKWSDVLKYVLIHQYVPTHQLWLLTRPVHHVVLIMIKTSASVTLRPVMFLSGARDLPVWRTAVCCPAAVCPVFWNTPSRSHGATSRDIFSRTHLTFWNRGSFRAIPCTYPLITPCILAIQGTLRGIVRSVPWLPGRHGVLRRSRVSLVLRVPLLPAPPRFGWAVKAQ